jgi:ABC-type dipeptide/oligopeptide/nickel transport system permease component
MDRAVSKFVSVAYSVPAFVFVLSCVVYLFGRLLLNFLHGGQSFFAPGSSIDQAEKGSIKSHEDLSEEEVFQLEKRAFFSKVGDP